MADRNCPYHKRECQEFCPLIFHFPFYGICPNYHSIAKENVRKFGRYVM